MNEMSFDSVFRAAFGKAGDANFQPYAYQCRLACGEPPEAANADLDNPDEATRDWLSRPDPGGCRSRLIDIPTGLGKTAAVVLAWLWNRTIVPSLNSQQTAHGSLPDEGESTLNHSKWPRRLVYCLPMRTLVEQTASGVGKWLRNIRDAALSGKLAFFEATLHDLIWLAGTEGLSPSEILNLPSGISANTTKPHSPIIGPFRLAFAEGRFLTIHPFLDFNGCTIASSSSNCSVVSIPARGPHPGQRNARASHFAALEAVDHHALLLLVEIWRGRFRAPSSEITD